MAAEVSVAVDAADMAELQHAMMSLTPGAGELGHPTMPKAGTPMPTPTTPGRILPAPKNASSKAKAKAAPVKQVGLTAHTLHRSQESNGMILVDVFRLFHLAAQCLPNMLAIIIVFVEAVDTTSPEHATRDLLKMAGDLSTCLLQLKTVPYGVAESGSKYGHM